MHLNNWKLTWLSREAHRSHYSVMYGNFRRLKESGYFCHKIDEHHSSSSHWDVNPLKRFLKRSIAVSKRWRWRKIELNLRLLCEKICEKRFSISIAKWNRIFLQGGERDIDRRGNNSCAVECRTTTTEENGRWHKSEHKLISFRLHPHCSYDVSGEKKSLAVIYSSWHRVCSRAWFGAFFRCNLRAIKLPCML